jgi:hypothetical protein
MATSTTGTERRIERRLASDDVIRWKRPGRIEDHKGWSVDRSLSGLGFLVEAPAAPRVGERLHVRQLDGDRWTVLDRTYCVVRADPANGGDFAFVGCRIL